MSQKNKKKNVVNVQQEKVLKAVVIADSFNTRFYPVSLKRPRCLLPLANKPLLSYTFEFLSSCEVEHVYVYCCHCSEQVKTFLQESKWSESSSPLKVTPIVSSGFTSVGDVLRDVDQKGLFESDFLLVPGDIISNACLKQALAEHRERRERDKNIPLMTLVLRSLPPQHKARSAENDVVIASDSSTNRVLHYHKLTNKDKKIKVPLGIFQKKESRIEMRYDLSDTGIWICSPVVSQLFTDNFDYQTQFEFVKGVLLNEEFLGNHIHMHVIRGNYCARVHNFHVYDVVSRDIAARWMCPYVPEINFEKLTLSDDDLNKQFEEDCFCSLRNNIYWHGTCVFGSRTSVEQNTVIGKNTQVGNNCFISNSVIGEGCCIEDNCKITDTYLWNNVKIEQNCNITKSLICDDVCVYQNSTIAGGSILCDKVSAGPNVDLSSKTVVCVSHDEDKKVDACVGANGNAFIWDVDFDEEDTELSDVTSIWGLSLADHKSLAEKLSIQEDSESESSSLEDSGGEEGEENFSDQLEVDDDLSSFQREVSESIREGIKENCASDNLILELNSSKYAYNMSMKDLIQIIMKSILDIAAQHTDDNSKYFGHLKKVLTYTTPVLCHYNKTASCQLDCVYALEDCLDQNSLSFNNEAKIFNFLYDNDILSEEVILHWNARPKSEKNSAIEIRKRLEIFISWLEEAEEEEDSD